VNSFYQYTYNASRFTNPALTGEKLAIMTVVGLVGECAEFAEVNIEDKEHVKKELGDICWYLSQSTRVFNLSFGDLMVKAVVEATIPIMCEHTVYRMLINSCKILEHMKKVWFHDHKINRVFLTEQYEKVFSDLAMIELCLLGEGMYDVLETNINKLSERYPHGFTSSDSINRKDGDDTFKQEMKE
jgi:hypothetical protein